MTTKTRSLTTPRFPDNIAQRIYLNRAGVASGIYAKYADVGSVPTNLISGGGIKPLTNKQQPPPDAAGQPPAPEPQQPAQPTQPAAPAIEPIPAGVPAPPVVPPPQSATPPATNMATGKPITPGTPMAPAGQQATPAAGTINDSNQITGQPAPTTHMPMHIENPANPGDSAPAPAQTHIAPDANAHRPITGPEAVNPPPPTGQNHTDQPPTAGSAAPTPDQPADQPADRPTATPAPRFTEPEVATFEQINDPKQFGSAFEKMTPEQRLQVAPRWLQKWGSDPKNAAMINGVKDLQSGDPQRVNSPGAQHAKKFMDGLAPQLREQFAGENFQKFMAAHPNATPQEQGNFMRQAYDQAAQSVQAMPWPAQLMMGLGLSAGLVGMFSSMFGEGGAESGLLGLLGIGAAGLIGANYGMFGNDARKMLGQGAVGLGRMMKMNIPGADAFTPQGMQKAKDDAAKKILYAISGNADEKIPKGGWQGGLKKVEELRAPLDQLANMAATYGKDFAITTLMGAMNTNNPSAAQQQFDMLMKQRQQMLDPQYLRNQILADPKGGRLGLAGLELLHGQYPGAAPAPAAPRK